MIKNILYILVLFGLIGFSLACDGQEEAFVISNDLPRPATIQIIEQIASGATLRLGLARATGETLKPSLLLAPGKNDSIFSDGLVGGRVAYVIVISDESDKELFRRTFPRDELIKHKFRLTVTEQGIEYSP